MVLLPTEQIIGVYNNCSPIKIDGQYKSCTGSVQEIQIVRDSSYLVKNDSKSFSKYTEEGVIKNAWIFFINNIFVQWDGRVFQQTVGIPMSTNCDPLLADLFLHTFEADFIADPIQ